MKRTTMLRRTLFALAIAGAFPAFGQNVLQPGDAIVASSSNSPGSEGVANAIDGKQTKYLNFDARGTDPELIPHTGFAVTPSIGVTRVTGMRIQSANDAPERDPKLVILQGSNDATLTGYNSGTWEDITTITAAPFAARFEWQTFSFPNLKPYRHYRWIVDDTAAPNGCCMQVAEVELLGGILPPDVTQPGDALIASSSNSPGSEGVANAIDGKQTKYLNFDSRGTDPALIPPSGFVVTPAIGRTVVTGMTIQTANDGPERDPKVVILEGSNDATIATYNSGTWEQITLQNVPVITERFTTQTLLFDNVKPYTHYRWIVKETASPNGCCMQVAEVELLGTGAPKDVTQPGDALIASSSNSPGSEGVANAIDNKQTKYLNFDSRGTDPALIPSSGFVVTPSIGATVVTGMTIQTANDGPERDPKVVTLEGSNDDTITSYNSGTWELITTITAEPTTARFATAEFYFPNTKSYKHYRWVTEETASPNGCCMQVAEVELLAVPQGVDCAKTKFLAQPVNTPVLDGSMATFSVTVNGPWPLQWLKNGEIIPGAIGTTYTTPAVTAANAADKYSVQIVGCEISSEVTANIFTPASDVSYGVNFIGGGANGAPTAMNVDDITGIHPQAYWNNAPNAGAGVMPDDTTDPALNFVSSNNERTDVAFEWISGGTWGSGTGDSSATQRLLNGLTGATGPGTPNTYSFYNVPAGTHSVIVYAVSPPLQFQTVSFKVGETTYFMRTMNSDEYNAAPGFYRGFSTDRNNPTVGNFVRFDNVQGGGTITLETETLTTGFDRPTGVNAIQLVLNADNPGNPPQVTVDPQPAQVELDSTARLSVTATGQNLTYQWRKNGRSLPNGGNISGATTATLNIANFSDADAGVYSVAIFNAAGSVISKNASVSSSKFDIKDRLVAHWKMNETSGSTAANSVTTGSPGTVMGTASWGAGQIGNAINLDGSTYVHVPNFTKARAAISGSAWVNIDPNTSADVAIFRNAQGALAVDGGTTRLVGQFEVGLVYDINTGELRPMAAIGLGPNVGRATGTAAFPTGSWHHIAFTADGAQLRLFVDGAQVAVTDYLAEINAPDMNYISMGARLDANDPEAPTVIEPDLDAPNMLTGSLDDVALWTRGLSAVEVGLIHAAGMQAKDVSTVIVPKVVIETPEVSIARNGGNVVVTYKGVLESATSLSPPNWAPVGGNSPYTEATSAAVKFFRASGE